MARVFSEAHRSLPASPEKWEPFRSLPRNHESITRGPAIREGGYIKLLLLRYVLRNSNGAKKSYYCPPGWYIYFFCSGLTAACVLKCFFRRARRGRRIAFPFWNDAIFCFQSKKLKVFSNCFGLVLNIWGQSL